MPSPLRQAPVLLLDDARAHGGGRSMVFSAPERIIRADNPGEVPAALAALDQAVAAGKTVGGFFAYELGAVLEPAAASGTATSKTASTQSGDLQTPLIWLMVVDRAQALQPLDVADMLRDADAGNARRARLALDEPPGLDTWFADRFARVQDFISAGDVYQINLTYQCQARLDGDPLALYQALRRSQPAPYAAYIDTGFNRILSLSPELFVRRRGNRLEASPMKGTAPRGLDQTSDQQARQQLAHDPKTRAENLMIVDLLRNDISRLGASPIGQAVGRAGDGALGVRVENPFQVTAYPSLWQMTSDVVADLPAGLPLTPSGLLKALFPCGSVTGAPKVRAMQIIEQLESGPRGVYCGAIGFFSGTGAAADWCLNVPIRTLQLSQNGSGRLSVGAGLVADSDTREELAECRLKARFAVAAADTGPRPALIETMAVASDGTIPLQAAHMQRLARSAALLGYPCALSEIEARLTRFVAAHKGAAARLRLLLHADGRFALQRLGLDPPPARVRLGVASARLDSDAPARRVKSTDRRVYQQALAEARAWGLDDCIVLNQRGEIADTGIYTLFVEQPSGHWVTPPLSSGALDSVMRACVLTWRQVEERPLRLDDLYDARRLWVGNAVRGLLPAVLADTA